MNGSALSMEEYMRSYGPRLRSLLDPRTVGAPGSGPAPAAPGDARTYPLEQGPVPRVAARGASFRDKWQEMPKEEQKKFADDLEAQLEKGNKTIDSAYDDLVKQLGAPPEEGKLSREEKGMLLMEFGLALMANSSAQRYGTDLGGAIGASGLQALQGHRQRRAAARERYDERRHDLEKNRAAAKARLAEQSALEARAEARDQRRQERENQQIAQVVTGDDDMLYGVTRGGAISMLAQPSGQGVKAKDRTAGGTGGAGRTLEFDRRYQLYMDTYGKDTSGKPLEGEALGQVKRRALAFAADPRSATLSDAEMRTMAERSADAFMKSNWSLFRDMEAEEARAWRDRTAEENYQRLKEGRDIELTPPSAPAPAASAPASALEQPVRRGRGGPPKRTRSYPSPDAAQAALDRGELKSGDVIIINGKRYRVP